MLEWMNRVPRKSDTEKEYDRLTQQYKEVFGEEYPVVYSDFDIQEHMKTMRECIKTGKKKTVSPPPEGVLI